MELRSSVFPPGHVFISRERLSVAFDHLEKELMKIQNDQKGVLAKRMAALESQFEKLSFYVHEELRPRLQSDVAERR